MAIRRGLKAVLAFFIFMLVCGCLISWLFRDAADEDEGPGPRIGLVTIEGVIAQADEPLRELRRFSRDPQIKAVVLRIRSPGGAVGPSQELYREVERTRRSKPVVASLESVAASGGYYVAAACQRIIANPGTLTGSIGVITQTANVSQLLALARVDTATVKSGALKDVGSPLRAMTATDRDLLQGLVDAIQRQFLRDVARSRKLKEEALAPVADGRVLTGEQALALHLVDRLGNLSDALDEARDLAGATGEPAIVDARRRKGLLWRLVGEQAEGVLQRMLSHVPTGTTIEARSPLLQ